MTMSSSRRLHRWSVLFLLGDTLKGLVLPMAAVLFTARRSRWDLMLTWLSVPVGGISVWRYFTTTYELTGEELVLRTGLLFRNVRHIRYARVHNVEIVQGPLHRLLRVAEVRVETAGASEQEARLRVLSQPDAEEFRRRVIEGKRRGLNVAEPAPAPAAQAPAELVRLGWHDLVAFGLTQNRGGIVIGAFIGLLWEMNLLDSGGGQPTRIVGRFMNQVWSGGRLLEDPGRAQIGPAVAGLLAVLAFIRVLSLGWAVVQLHGFTLTRQDGELRSTRGLLTRVHSTIPVSRVQMVSVREPPLMRAFGRVEVRVQTAGGDQNATAGREWLAPAIRRENVDALIASVLPGIQLSAVEWQPADARAFRRMRRSHWGWIAAAFVAAVLFVPVPALVLVLPAAGFAWLAARGQARGLGHALLADHVATRGGWWWKHTSVARYAKVQAISLAESPFDRRWEMADVFADTAGGGSYQIAMPCLPAADARMVYTHLRDRVAPTEFRW
jgi:putative membrane protein